MKKMYVILLLLLVLVVSVLAMPSDSLIQECAKKLGVPFADLQAFLRPYYEQIDSMEPDYVLADRQSFGAFQKEYNNTYSFYQKYNNKCIEVQNVEVYSINPSLRDGYAYYIACIGIIGSYFNFWFFVDGSQVAKLSKIESGSKITVRGIVKEQPMASGQIYFFDCVIVEY